MALLQFLGRRALRGLLTFWFAVTVTFFVLRLLPGDPTMAVADPGMTEAVRQSLLEHYGLDRPLWVQYELYLLQLAHGDLGLSFRQHVPVTSVLAARLPWTLLLTGSALVVTVLLGIPLGVLAATHRRGWIDRAIQIFAVTGQSLFVPSVGILLLYSAGLMLKLFPIGGAIDADLTGVAALRSIVMHLVLPCLSLVLVQLGPYVLTLRATLSHALAQDYCDLARAKGAGPMRIVWRHALRNALLPTTTLLGLQIGFLVGGAVLTETVFAYPGLGRAMFEAVGQLDFPVLQGAFVMLAATVVLANLLTDLACGLIDPRVRLA
ncbi:MAG TPA: ABC transporter permease [Aliidongia sp.]|nr:ABC transporter permease [Aliidongia sp.]